MNDQHEYVNTGMKTDHLQKDFKLCVMKFFLLCSLSSLSSLTGMSMPMAKAMAILAVRYKILAFRYLYSIKLPVSCGLRAVFFPTRSKHNNIIGIILMLRVISIR